MTEMLLGRVGVGVFVVCFKVPKKEYPKRFPEGEVPHCQDGKTPLGCAYARDRAGAGRQPFGGASKDTEKHSY